MVIIIIYFLVPSEPPLSESFEFYATRPAVGWRMKKKDQTWDNKYTWITYRELKTTADTFARGMMEIGLKRVGQTYYSVITNIRCRRKI